MSTLGSLPSFGSGGRLTGGGGLTSQSDLDTGINSLLGGRKDKERKRKDRSSRTTGTNDADFYSQIAASMADNSFDDSGEDDGMTQDEAKQLAQSVDVDDMDASLFSSFQSQRRNSKPRNRYSGPSVSRKSEPAGDSKRKEPVTKQIDREKVPPVVEAPVVGQMNMNHKGSSTKSTESKKSKLDFDDDLLDLLSDSEDIAPKKRTKPKIQLTQKSKQHTAKPDGKPITSIKDDSVLPDLDLERPGTSRGNPLLENNPRHSATAVQKESSTDTNVLTLDSPHQSNIVSRRSLSAKSSKSSESSSSVHSRGVDFDEDDDDILGSMGFDDSSTQSSKRGSSKADASSTRLDDILGVGKPKSKPDTGSKSTHFSSRIGNTSTTTTDEDSFQFGSYVPSSVDISSASPKQSLKLPSGRRRGSSELDTSITTRPNSAPSPAKKSVHFAQKLETSERPSSSPSISEPKKPSLKVEKVTFDRQTASKRAPGSTSKDGVPGSRKPPLPVKAEGGGTAGLEDSQVGEKGDVVESGDFSLDSSTQHNQSSSTGISLNNSLLPSDESTPKHFSANRSRRRPASPTTDSLLIGNQSQEDIGIMSNNTNEPTPKEQLRLSRDSLNESEQLEHPIFPWQKRKPSTGGMSINEAQSRQQTTALTAMSKNKPPITTPQQIPPLGDHMSLSLGDLSFDQNSKLVSFQEQLLQQQKLMQEQLVSFQAQNSGAIAAAKVTSSVEIDRLQGEVKIAHEKVEELEGDVEKKAVELSDKQKTLSDLEKQLQSSKDAGHRLEEQRKQATDETATLDQELTQVKLEMSSQIEDLKIKLYKVELERDQFQHTIESMKGRHTEELEAIQKLHESRVKALEESFHRRETRWREEAETDSVRFQDKLTHLEQEKTDAVIAMKKKLDALEISKTNEIGRLQDLHYSSVEELKREHELDKQHLLSLHRQELEAIKAAHSHTRMLSELSHKVESSTRDVSHLQAKLEHAHSTELDERLQRAMSHEEHLKTLEAQLIKQKTENDSERERLQSLIAKMESHVSRQNKQTEQERWQLQQDTARLTAQQSAFEDERASSLLRLESEREKLQQTKEKFLAEQKEILSQCYEERRSLATERAELSVLHKKALEREQKDKQMSLQSEAEQEATQSHLRGESGRILSEGTKLKHDQEQLRLDQEAVNRDREKLEAFGAEIQQRSQEIEEITETAMLVREKGERSLTEGQRLQEELAEQVRAAQVQREGLAEKEKLLAVEQLSLAQERRKLQHLKVMSLSAPVFADHSEDAMKERMQPLLSSTQALHNCDSLQSLSTTSLSSLRDGVLVGGIPAPSGYSPRASPVHSSTLTKPPHTVKSMLAKIDHSRSLRQLVLDAKKDDEYLEEETNFLQSLHANPYIY